MSSPMKTPLTKKQERVLRFIVDFREKNEVSPTRGEIAKAIGSKWPNAGAEHVKLIEKKGWIRLLPIGRRNIVVIP